LGTQDKRQRQTKQEHNNDKPEKQATLGTQDKSPMLPASLGCSCCLLVLFVFVFCLVYPMLPVSLGCSCCVLVLFCLQRNRQHWVHKTKDEQNKTRSQQEQLQRNRQHWVHKTKDKQNKTRTQQEQLQRNRQHWVHKTKDKDKQNKNTTMTTQRNRQHWVHKTKDKDKQNKNTTIWVVLVVFLFCFVCLLSCVPNVACFSVVVLVVFLFCFVRLLSCVPQRQTKQEHNNDNPEKQAQLGTQDNRQTKQNKHTTRTTQRSRQHWVHNTKDKDKQNKNTTMTTQKNRQNWGCHCCVLVLLVFFFCLVYPMLPVFL
jgi:Flp pilus assembly protein TadB